MTKLELEFRPSQMPEFIARSLLDELEQLGYEARMSDAPELRGVPVITEIVVWVGEHLADDALALVVGVLAGWGGRKWRDRRPDVPRAPESLTVKVLYKPDGSVLKEIEVEPPANDDL